MALDLSALEEEFEIKHPKAALDDRYKDVVFYTVPLPSEASFRIYENAKKKGGKIDAKFISDTFVRVCRNWAGLERDGVAVPCNEDEKRAFINNPGTSRLAQYIMDQTDQRARDLHGVDDD